MSNDSLDRIRNKKRPKVSSREDFIASVVHDNYHSFHQDTETNLNQDTETSRYQDLKTKASTIRLEETIATELAQLCREENISREVLIEAIFLYCQNHPSVLEAVLEKARTRNEHRQEISNRKRAQTMMKRFGEEK